MCLLSAYMYFKIFSTFMVCLTVCLLVSNIMVYKAYRFNDCMLILLKIKYNIDKSKIIAKNPNILIIK